MLDKNSGTRLLARVLFVVFVSSLAVADSGHHVFDYPGLHGHIYRGLFPDPTERAQSKCEHMPQCLILFYDVQCKKMRTRTCRSTRLS